MKITEVNNLNDFALLKDSWNDLLQRSGHTVFSTWKWLFTWWKHFGDNRHLLILLAFEDNKLIGIAPLMYSVYSMLGLRQGKIEFIGTGLTTRAASIIENDCDISGNNRTPSYADFIIEKGHEDCLRLFFDYLQNLQEKWVCAELRPIPENQIAMSRLSLLSNKIKIEAKNLHILLPPSNEALLRNIKRKDRKEIGRYLRRIEKCGFKIDLVDCSKPLLVSH
jgi:CelD/BcsL family acetyltransferase involved in cellulose biosynthesis